MGYAPRDSVLSYLGVSDIESWVVPQVVIIDRKGVIRAQSAARGTADLQTETYLRKYLGELLDEGKRLRRPRLRRRRLSDKKTQLDASS